MGNWATSWLQGERRGVITGLDGAGKSTLVLSLQMEQDLMYSPQWPSYKYCGCRWYEVTLRGQERIRPLLRMYWTGASYLIFVVDLSDRERILKAKYELHLLLADEGLSDARILIVGNKNDVDNCMSGSELIDKLDLHEYTNRNWEVIECSVTKQSSWKQQIDDFILA